jgi:L-ascorbate peroxidase
MKFLATPITALLATLSASGAAFVQRSVFGTTSRQAMTSLEASKEALSGAMTMIDGILDEKNCGPVMVRLAWHDSGTYDASINGEWPAAGGAIASIRFKPEISHGANAGLANAVKILEPVKEKFPEVSYADIFQMASARSIALAGGPMIDMK